MADPMAAKWLTCEMEAFVDLLLQHCLEKEILKKKIDWDLIAKKLSNGRETQLQVTQLQSCLRRMQRKASKDYADKRSGDVSRISIKLKSE